MFVKNNGFLRAKNISSFSLFILIFFFTNYWLLNKHKNIPRATSHLNTPKFHQIKILRVVESRKYSWINRKRLTVKTRRCWSWHLAVQIVNQGCQTLFWKVDGVKAKLCNINFSNNWKNKYIWMKIDFEYLVFHIFLWKLVTLNPRTAVRSQFKI